MYNANNTHKSNINFGSSRVTSQVILSKIMLVQADILLIIPSSMLNIPKVFQLSPVQGFQVIRPMSFAIDNLLGSFPIRSQFPMSWVSSCQRDPFQDKVPYVEAPRFHHCIILSGHKVFIPYCSLLHVHPYPVYQIKVKAELLFVILIFVLHHPVVGHIHFCRYHYFAFIGQLERSFPCRGSHSRPIGP